MDESDHEIHGAIEVGAIDNSIVGMSGTGRNKDRGDWDPAIVEFDGAGIISEARDEIELQGDMLVGSDLTEAQDCDADRFHRFTPAAYARALSSVSAADWPGL